VVFASFVFLFWFLPLFLTAYFAVPVRWRNVLIIAASFVFYGWWRPHYVLLMLLSIGLDYVAARAMGEPSSGRPRRFWLLFSIVTNLGLLGWFKYANLLVATWNDLAPTPIAWEQVLLPVGISFFTFQSMSYTIDVYRGVVKPERSFADLLCFVSMFPQLVAGPIVRYSDIQNELHHRTVDLRKLSNGALLLAFGLAKKVLIADPVGSLVDAVFAQSTPGLFASWLAGFGYSVQIYFDFSGYSDMAIGLGLMLGFHFPDNFLSPYKARSITEIWRRWHVSLSTWLRDYLYVPLGGNRRGEGRARLNLALTMLLGGLWHGPSWTYMLWGAWHGGFLVLERAFGKQAPYARLPHWAQVGCTFVIWTIGVVIFRSATMTEVGEMARGLVGAHGLGTLPDLGQHAPWAWGSLALGLGIAFFLPTSQQLVARGRPVVMLLALLLFVLAVCQLMTADLVAFIYYQF
jgi:alginate O-acetyltransferase complex protein AlgI